jgi:hypothetical protein
MSSHVQTANQIRAVLGTADQTGATLPEHLDAMARHALTLGSIDTTTPAATVDRMLDHLGDPAAFDKALPTALTEVAKAEALAAFKSQLLTAATLRAWQAIQTDREAVAAAIGKAVQPHVDVLTRHAGSIPPGIVPTSLDSLTTEQFDAWRRCEPAAAALESAANGLRALYPIDRDPVLNQHVVPRLPLVTVPESVTDAKTAYAFTDALEGRRRLGNAVSTLSDDRGGFWPARVAALSATFIFSGPAETLARAKHLRTLAAVRRPEPAGAR